MQKDLYEKNKAEYQQQMKNLIDEYWGDNPRIETHKKKNVESTRYIFRCTKYFD